MTGFTGGCLCGAVRYSSSAEPIMMGHCHCEDCRRTSSSDRASHIVVPEGQLEVSGALTAYDRPANSGNMVTRCFCPVCGSAILSLSLIHI